MGNGNHKRYHTSYDTSSQVTHDVQSHIGQAQFNALSGKLIKLSMKNMDIAVLTHPYYNSTIDDGNMQICHAQLNSLSGILIKDRVKHVIYVNQRRRPPHQYYNSSMDGDANATILHA